MSGSTAAEAAGGTFAPHGRVKTTESQKTTASDFIRLLVIRVHKIIKNSLARKQTAGCHRGTGRCGADSRSEEHTSELQSRENLVCRLLLEKKKQTIKPR